MLKKTAIIISLIIFTFVFFKACISSHNIFYGRVVDQLGYPVVGAQVIYVSNSGFMGNSKAFGVLTDYDGRFTAENDGGWMFSIQSIKLDGYLMDMLNQPGKTNLFIHAEKPVEYGDWDNSTPQKPYTYVMYKKPTKTYLLLHHLYGSAFSFNRNKDLSHNPDLIYDTPSYFKFVFDKSPKYEGDCRKYKDNPQDCPFPVKRKNSVFIWPATADDADFSVALSKLEATLVGEPNFVETLLKVQTYGIMNIQLISEKFIDKHNYKSYQDRQYYFEKRGRLKSPLYPYLAHQSGYNKSIQLILDSYGSEPNMFYFRYGDLYGKMAIGFSYRLFQLSIRFYLNMDGGRELDSKDLDYFNNKNFIQSIGNYDFDFNPLR